MKWFWIVMKKAAVLEGRARRKEYWMFTLVSCVIVFGLTVADYILGWMLMPDVGVLSTIASLIFLVPNIAVSVRRLHDIGKSGWWLLLFFVPIIGPIALLVMFCFDSEAYANRFGVNPKYNL